MRTGNYRNETHRQDGHSFIHHDPASSAPHTADAPANLEPKRRLGLSDPKLHTWNHGKMSRIRERRLDIRLESLKALRQSRFGSARIREPLNRKEPLEI
jgi:hypothetical protein